MEHLPRGTGTEWSITRIVSEATPDNGCLVYSASRLDQGEPCRSCRLCSARRLTQRATNHLIGPATQQRPRTRPIWVWLAAVVLTDARQYTALHMHRAILKVNANVVQRCGSSRPWLALTSGAPHSRCRGAKASRNQNWQRNSGPRSPIRPRMTHWIDGSGRLRWTSRACVASDLAAVTVFSHAGWQCAASEVHSARCAVSLAHDSTLQPRGAFVSAHVEVPG
jgi:hypothetical protein